MRARLRGIEIANFKSFLGKQDLTPLMQWNTIKAPNGSGKSSLIDAITFGLGETDYSQLRIKDLSELIPQASLPRLGLTYVRLTISSREDSTIFYRALIKNGGIQYESLYTVDGKIVEAADYLNRLKTYGINIQAKDFVVYQGKINDIIEASPLDRSHMLEIASGSIEFKVSYDNLTQEITTIHQQVVSASGDRKKFKDEIARYNKALKRAEESEEHQRQFKESLRQSYLLQLKINDLQNETLGPDIPPVNEPSLIDEAKQESRLAEKTVKKIAEIRHQLQKETQSRDELRTKLHEINTLESTYQKEIDKLNKLLNEEERRNSCIEDIDEQIRDNEKLLQGYSKELIEFDQQNLHYAEHETEYYRLHSLIQQQIAVKLSSNDSVPHPREFTTELNHLLKKYKNLQNSIKDHQTSIVEKKESIKKYKTGLEVIKTDINKLNNEIKEKSKLLLTPEDVKALEKRKQEIDEQFAIHDVSSVNAQSLRRQEETLSRLKSQFPGKVYNRIINLSRVSDNKYKIVMAAALDKNLNAIIVEDDETAAECLMFLQRERLGFETFYSIKGVSPPVLDRNILLKLGIPAKLVYDILKFNVQFKPVIESIVKSTVLCETLEDAWRIMDRMKILKRKHNIVTMAGELLTTRCTVSAGFNQRRIQSERIQTVNQNVLGLEREEIVDKLGSYRDGSLMREIENLKIQLKLKNRWKVNLVNSIDETLRKIEEAEGMLEDLEGQLEKVGEEKNELEKQRERFNCNRELIKGEIEELRRNIFQDFCGALGIEDVGVFEEKVKKKNELDEKRKKAEVHLSESNYLKDSEKCRSRAGEVDKWRDECKCLEEKQKDLKLELEKLNEEKGRVDSSIKKLEAILEKERNVLNGIEIKRKSLVTLESRNRRKSARDSRLREELRKRRREIISAAELDDVAFTEIENSESQSSEDDSQKEYDFRGLKPEWQRSRDVNYLRDELVMLKETLEETRMKVDEYGIGKPDAEGTLEALKGELKRVEAKVEGLRKREKRIRGELEEVKRQRLEAFTSFFDKTADVIDGICKRINNSNAAYALLVPENPDEPYLQGIRYDCTPAGKKFRSGEQLSGGEKAMAGLTFLFALQESRSSSLVILDEVDGALDWKFVRGFVNYLCNLKNKHQIFMISHNHVISAGADVVLCVAPNVSSGHLSSIPIMIDLAGKLRNGQQS